MVKGNVGLRERVKVVYKELYWKHTWETILDGIDFCRLFEHDNLLLDQPFTEEEINAELMSCKGDKGPWLDDFNG